ncbi:hypothetical protein OHB14_50785 [Streptomyces sp. NBC_01613]|uniref:hypothetical protein n=1 Tax=Streptomyces sp. NBC_01613 TaxID=2975896 RepID=UPI00386A102E
MSTSSASSQCSAGAGAIGWWQRQCWIERDPTIGIERRPTPPDRSTDSATALSPTTPKAAPPPRCC